MMNTILVPLSHGMEYKGKIIYHAKLRQMNGYDEQYVENLENKMPVSLLASKFLSRLLWFENKNKKKGIRPEENIVENLSVGDRTSLMLHVRRLTFGELMKCNINCPDCQKKISFEINVKTLLDMHSRQRKEDEITIGGYALKVRPLRGMDQKSLLTLDFVDESIFAENLVRSCIVYSNPTLPKKLENDFIIQIAEKLEEIDPLADVVLELSCPSCKNLFRTNFPIEDFIFQEIKKRLFQHDREVHWLAFNYHWDEKTILSLSLPRRKKYVELINKTLSGEAL